MRWDATCTVLQHLVVRRCTAEVWTVEVSVRFLTYVCMSQQKKVIPIYAAIYDCFLSQGPTTSAYIDMFYMHMCMNICIHTHIFIYIYKYIYTHTLSVCVYVYT